MKIKIKFAKGIFSLITIVILTVAFGLSASAHTLQAWANYYTPNHANSNSGYRFTIENWNHMNGSSINYVWANNTTQTTFGTALSQAFSSSWGGMISGSNTTSANAHLRIAYDSITQPTGIAAIAPINGGDANKHFRQGLQSHGSHDSGILFYMDSANYSADIKKQLTAHELGHLWGIEDLYRHGFTNLESIYSQPYAYNTATRHDKNAMYIGLNNPWFDDGTGNGWKRLKSPGVFAVNEWHDGYYFNSNGYWT